MHLAHIVWGLYSREGSDNISAEREKDVHTTHLRGVACIGTKIYLSTSYTDARTKPLGKFPTNYPDCDSIAGECVCI